MILFEQTPYHEKRKLGKTDFPCDPKKPRTTDGNKFRIVRSMLEKTLEKLQSVIQRYVMHSSKTITTLS